MAQEIERKFLVAGPYKPLAVKSTRITQGYLNSVPERTVRVRVKGDKGFITVKGIGNKSGASRYEWEKEIPVEDVRSLLELCEPGVIDKTRYLVKAGPHTFEVDEFYGENEGLTLAEIGSILGVTESRVSQIHTKAVLHLRARLSATGVA